MCRARRLERRASTGGFTIIEVLVALAVVAASLAAIGALIASTARGTRSIEQHVGLVETARAIEAMTSDRRLAAGEQTGEGGGYAWQMQVAPFGQARGGEAWQPQHVVIAVRAPSGAVLRLDTVRLQRRTEP